MKALVVFTVLFTAILPGVARVFRLSRADRWATLLEFPCRNLAIAAVVAFPVLDRT